MAKKAKKAKSTRKTATKAASTNARNRVKYEDDAKITVVGEHNRREDSRYGQAYATLAKSKTVGAFRKAREKDADAQEILRAATAEGYIKVAA